MSGAKQGVRKSIPLLLGVDLVYIICSLIIGFGLGELLKTYPTFMIVIKLLGITYLFYVVYKFLKPVKHSVEENNNETLAVYTFYDGVILQALNPKGWTVLFVMFSLFLDGSFGHTAQVIYLVVMIAVLNISTHLVWIVAGAFITQYVANPATEKYINYSFALSLLLVAIWLLMDTLSAI
jgi:threonine/homoserine/homoserine lactone efflux protein